MRRTMNPCRPGLMLAIAFTLGMAWAGPVHSANVEDETTAVPCQDRILFLANEAAVRASAIDAQVATLAHRSSKWREADKALNELSDTQRFDRSFWQSKIETLPPGDLGLRQFHDYRRTQRDQAFAAIENIRLMLRKASLDAGTNPEVVPPSRRLRLPWRKAKASGMDLFVEQARRYAQAVQMKVDRSQEAEEVWKVAAKEVERARQDLDAQRLAIDAAARRPEIARSPERDYFRAELKETDSAIRRHNVILAAFTAASAKIFENISSEVSEKGLASNAPAVPLRIPALETIMESSLRNLADQGERVQTIEQARERMRKAEEAASFASKLLAQERKATAQPARAIGSNRLVAASAALEKAIRESRDLMAPLEEKMSSLSQVDPLNQKAYQRLTELLLSHETHQQKLREAWGKIPELVGRLVDGRDPIVLPPEAGEAAGVFDRSLAVLLDVVREASADTRKAVSAVLEKREQREQVIEALRERLERVKASIAAEEATGLKNQDNTAEKLLSGQRKHLWDSLHADLEGDLNALLSDPF